MTSFSPSTLVCPVSIIPLVLHTHTASTFGAVQTSPATASLNRAHPSLCSLPGVFSNATRSFSYYLRLQSQPQTNYPDWSDSWFSSIPHDKCQDNSYQVISVPSSRGNEMSRSVGKQLRRYAILCHRTAQIWCYPIVYVDDTWEQLPQHSKQPTDYIQTTACNKLSTSLYCVWSSSSTSHMQHYCHPAASSMIV